MAEVALVEGWVELELLGHRRHQGELSVRRIVPEPGSPILLELRTPAIDDKPGETHFYTPQAVYGIHPTTEAAVRDALTPSHDCEAKFYSEALRADDTCILPRGHEGYHEGLPF
jgi:hypothetical protein